MTDVENEKGVSCELAIFSCKLVYVYKIPPQSSIGHRAELWDVDNPAQEIALKVVVFGQDCLVKLFDEKGDLFAECPIPNPEQAPLETALDAVIDSSRFFVLRLEDKATKRHAFIGIGFLKRNEASDFSAAIAEHLQSLRRLKKAAKMREEFLANKSEEALQGPSNSVPQTDMRLQEGQTLTLNLKNKRQSSSKWESLKSAAGAAELNAGKGLINLSLPNVPGEQGKKKLNDSARVTDDWGEFVT